MKPAEFGYITTEAPPRLWFGAGAGSARGSAGSELMEEVDGLWDVHAVRAPRWLSQVDAFNGGFKLVDAAEEWGRDGAWLAELNPADRSHRPKLCPVSRF